MKKKTKYTKLITLFTLIVIATLANAKNRTSDLAIDRVFEMYKKAKGSTMTVVKNSNEIEYFKSLVIEIDNNAAQITRNCIDKDKKSAKKIKEIYTNGELTTIFLQLPPKNSTNRIILFNETKNRDYKLTLIYIETEKKPEKIFDILFNKR